MIYDTARCCQSSSSRKLVSFLEGMVSGLRGDDLELALTQLANLEEQRVVLCAEWAKEMEEA